MIEEKRYVSYYPITLFCFIFSLPLAVIASCLILFYSLDQNSNLINNVPSIEDIIQEFPEVRVFTVGITVTSWLIVAALVLVDRALRSSIGRKLSKSVCAKKQARHASDFFGSLIFFTLLIFGLVPPEFSFTFHEVVFALFASSVVVFSSLLESILPCSNKALLASSIFIDIAIVAVSAAQVYFSFSTSTAGADAYAILEYVDLLLLSTKALVTWYLLPEFDLFLVKKVV